MDSFTLSSAAFPLLKDGLHLALPYPGQQVSLLSFCFSELPVFHALEKMSCSKHLSNASWGPIALGCGHRCQHRAEHGARATSKAACLSVSEDIPLRDSGPVLLTVSFHALLPGRHAENHPKQTQSAETRTRRRTRTRKAPRPSLPPRGRGGEKGSPGGHPPPSWSHVPRTVRHFLLPPHGLILTSYFFFCVTLVCPDARKTKLTWKDTNRRSPFTRPHLLNRILKTRS